MCSPAPCSSAQAQYLGCRRQGLGHGPSFSSPVSVSLSVPLLQFRFTLEHNRGCKSYYSPPPEHILSNEEMGSKREYPVSGISPQVVKCNNKRRTRCQSSGPHSHTASVLKRLEPSLGVYEIGGTPDQWLTAENDTVSSERSTCTPSFMPFLIKTPLTVGDHILLPCHLHLPRVFPSSSPTSTFLQNWLILLIQIPLYWCEGGC